MPQALQALQHQLTQRGKTAKNQRRIAPPPPPKRHTTNIISHRRSNSNRRTHARVDRLNRRLAKHRDKVLQLKDSGVGRYLVILACGPSTEYAELEKLAGHRLVDVMTINKPNKRLWPTKYWVFCDQSQYKRNRAMFHSYRGTLINGSSVKVDRENQIIIKNIHGRGFSKDLLAGYHLGRSTTYANLQTALWMKYDKVFIFGCDMAKVDGKLHFYGVNPDVKERIRESRFEAEAEHYAYAAKHLSAGDRSRFYFCSRHNPWPFVEEFNRMDEQTAVDEILKMAENLS